MMLFSSRHSFALLALLGFASIGGIPSDAPPVVVANDNRHSGGALKAGVLTIRLVAATARWYPETENGPFVDVPVLAEEGGPPQIPAPLIRVPAGTTIDATIRNTLDSTIYMWGLSTKPAKAYDSIPILPGETRTIRFDAGAAGTYHYAASVGIPTFGITPEARSVEGQQMAGGLIVDEPGTPINDRVFVVNIWGRKLDSTTYRNVLAINGKSWPYTERISANVGDTLRWRVINPSLRNHPMHLHGFYFRVDSHGIPTRDSIYSPDLRRYAVTEDLTTLHSMSMVWSPNRPGNWLFHCHLAFHVVPEARLDPRNASHETHQGDATKHMAGLVLGINVQPTAAFKAAPRVHPRELRLFVDEGKPRHVAPRALGYVLQRDRRPPAVDSVEIPGTTLVLTRGQPTDITVVNRLRESTAVHWHGLELESYSDGVAGWSGMGRHLAPSIAPGGSFKARLTMPRAGTFIYHTHINDVEQITSGLYGAIVVLEPGQRFDPRTDHVFVVGWDGPRRVPPRLIVNGDSASPPLELAFSAPHRLRFINIGAGGRVIFALRQDSTLLKWRRLAKDGADLPAGAAVVAPAIQRLGVGEMFDAEFTPAEKGEYVLTVGSPLSPRTYRRKIVVR
jgi:FtsP/CotA-like multicopper oxidase with cupredoxin domain